MTASVVRALRHSGRLEGGHAVRDGLDARDRAAAVGEGAHQQEQAERSRPAPTTSVTPVTCGVSPSSVRPMPIAISAEHDDEEDIGRDREDRPALADAAQVDQHDDEDADASRAGRGCRAQLRERRRDRGHAGRDADRHGQDVVDQQGRGGDEPGQLPEVLAATM